MRLRNPASGTVPADIARRELAFAHTLPRREDVDAEAKGSGRAPMSAAWKAIGPDNVGGRTRALAVDAADERNLLAGGVSGGMWRSTDGGATWHRTTPPDALHAVSCIAQDRRAGKRNVWYYAAGGELEGASPQGGGGAYFHGDGIYRSVDSGETWTILPATRTGTPQAWDGPFDYVWNIATDPSNQSESRVYASTQGAVQRSTDGGGTWTRTLGNGDARFTDVAVAPNGAAYATLSSDGQVKGIWRSADGVAWVQITPSGWPASFGRIVIGIAPSNPSVVYFYGITPGAGTNGQSLWKYRYQSGDGTGAGGAWENRSGSLPTAASMGSDVGGWGGSGYSLVIAVHPVKEDVVFIGGANLYRSTDGFATPGNVKWIGGYTPSVWQVPYHHCDQHAIAFGLTNPVKLYSGHDGGLSVLDDGEAQTVRWRSLDNGYRTTQFYTIAVAPRASDSVKAAGGMQDNGCWFQIGDRTRWRSYWGGYGTYAGDGGFCAIVNDTTVYYAQQQGDIHRINPNDSGSYGASVTPPGSRNRAFVTPYLLDPMNASVMYLAAGNRVWRNSNLATADPANNNWAELTATALAGGNVTALAGSARPAGRLYFGSSQGKVFRVDDALHAVPDDASAVRDISGAGFPSGAYVSCIAVDPSDADHILVVFSNYAVRSLFYSADGGGSWRDVSGNLEEKPNGGGAGPSCRWAQILPVAGGTVYLVATSTGLYSSRDIAGAAPTWAQEGAGVIGNVVVDMIAARAADGFVMIGTHGAGAFTATFALPPAPVADFTADRTSGDTGTVIHLSDLSTNVPTSWRWAFTPEGVQYLEGTTANSANPIVKFSAAGAYTVQLNVANAGGADSATKAAYVTIGLSGIGDRRSDVVVSSGMDLRCVPNPARTAATLTFRLPMRGHARLRLFDARGALVATYLESVLDAGAHDVRLDLTPLIPGAYYYRLEYAGASEMVPLRVVP